MCHSLFFNKVAGLRPTPLLKKRLWHRCFPEFRTIFKRTFFEGNLWRTGSERRLMHTKVYYSQKKPLTNLQKQQLQKTKILQCVCYWYNLLRWMFFVPCDSWKSLLLYELIITVWLFFKCCCILWSNCVEKICIFNPLSPWTTFQSNAGKQRSKIKLTHIILIKYTLSICERTCFFQRERFCKNSTLYGKHLFRNQILKRLTISLEECLNNVQTNTKHLVCYKNVIESVRMASNSKQRTGEELRKHRKTKNYLSKK